MNSSPRAGGPGPRFVLAGLILIFTLPFIAAWFIYNFTEVGKGEGNNSYGELIIPPVVLPDLELLDLTTGEVSHQLHGKWGLLYISSGACTEECQERLELVQGIIVALGKDSARLQSILAITETGPETDVKAGLGKKRVLLIEKIEAIRGPIQTGMQKNAEILQPGRLYLIDPMGNLMMEYPQVSDASGIIKDLKRLLRYSRIG